MASATDARGALRRALVIDAVASGGMGVLLALAAGMLEGMLGLSAELLRGASLILLPFAALLVYLARRQPIPDGAIWAVIAGNVLWVVASFGLLGIVWEDVTALGALFVLAQALTVAVFVYLEYAGLRSASPRRANAI